MLNLSLDELKLIAKNTGIKGYKSMSEENEKNFDDARIEKIKKDFLD